MYQISERGPGAPKISKNGIRDLGPGNGGAPGYDGQNPAAGLPAKPGRALGPIYPLRARWRPRRVEFW